MNNFTPHNLSNFNQFINHVGNLSINEKRLMTRFSDPTIKKINDDFTNIVNKIYITSENNLLDQYMYEVMTIFGDYDSLDLRPLNAINISNNSAVIQERIINDPNVVSDYIHDRNLFNPPPQRTHGTAPQQIYPNGYFVFKGGNIIKYHTMVKYLFIYHHLNNFTIQQFLSQNFLKTHDVNGILNTYSDFDFSYYVQQYENNDTTSNQLYTNIIHQYLSKHTAYRTFILRNRVELSFDDYVNNLDIHRLMLNSSLHSNIQAYFEIEDKNIGKIYTKVERLHGKNYSDSNYHQQISLVNNVKSSIVHKVLDANDPNNDMTHVYMLNENKRTKVTINYTIKTNRSDFDLYRIKIMFGVNNNYNRCDFTSELFDLTIIRPIVPNDTGPYKETVNNFYKNINEYTKLIKTSYNGQEFYVRAYSLLYTLKDLVILLFDDKSLFPWSDKKYNKRIVRLGFMYAGYIDDLNNTHNNNVSYKFLQLYLMLYLMILQYKFSNTVDLLETSNDNIRRDTFYNIIYRSIVEMIVLMRINNHDNLYFTNGVNNTLIRHILINKIFKMYHRVIIGSPQDYICMYKLYNYKEDFYDNYRIVDHIINIIMLFIYKIYIVIDIGWCNQQNKNANINININNFKMELCNFFKTLVINFLIGLDCQTNILSNFNFGNHSTDDIVLHGGGPDSYKNKYEQYFIESLSEINTTLMEKRIQFKEKNLNEDIITHYTDIIMDDKQIKEDLTYINNFYSYVTFIKLFQNEILYDHSIKTFNYDHSSMNITEHYYNAVKQIHKYHTQLTEPRESTESSILAFIPSLRKSLITHSELPTRENSRASASSSSSSGYSVPASREQFRVLSREPSGDLSKEQTRILSRNPSRAQIRKSSTDTLETLETLETLDISTEPPVNKIPETKQPVKQGWTV
jgi:hypothetical protein